MDILNSDWLISMLKKSSKTPQGRMLALFDILGDWLSAPGINTPIQFDNKPINLHHYLSAQASHAGAALPDMLATQLVLMAVSACKSKLEADEASAGDALSHAKSAAQALIIAQTKNEFHIAKSSIYATAACFVAALAIAASFFAMNQYHAAKTPKIALTTQPSITTVALANPEDTAALFAQIEQMRKGTCQLPEALQMPDSYKKVYFENIVLGQISTDPSEQKLVRQLLEKVRCNYTPMLMANSKN